MKKIMTDSISQEFSSRRHFHWTKKVSNEEDEDEELPPPPLKPSSNPTHPDENLKKDSGNADQHPPTSSPAASKKKLPAVAVSRIRSVLTAFARNRSHLHLGLGTRVVGTLFGSRRGHVHFAFQRDPASQPAFLVELATPISGLVREMASGLVRIALECDKAPAPAPEEADEKKSAAPPERRRRVPLLLEEPRWRTYCNGRKYGFAARRECGAKEWNVLRAVEPISMGAGVLPPPAKEADSVDSDGGDEEIMYMRAKFERVVGSRDSEAFYMMNPDSHGAPELSIYLLRV